MIEQASVQLIVKVVAPLPAWRPSDICVLSDCILEQGLFKDGLNDDALGRPVTYLVVAVPHHHKVFQVRVFAAGLEHLQQLSNLRVFGHDQYKLVLCWRMLQQVIKPAPDYFTICLVMVAGP